MILKNLVDAGSKARARREKVKAAQKLASKTVNTVEDIKNTIQKKAEAVKDSTAHAAQEASNAIKDIHGKTEGVKKDIKDGYHEIAQDLHKTAESISNELNKPVK